MKNLGVLVLVNSDNGGTFQYTLSMIEALKHIDSLTITLYTSKNNSCYDHLDYPIKRIDSSKINILRLLLQDILHLPSNDTFIKEDLILAPIYSSYLLHSRVKFIYTLHDLQERYYPEYFSFSQRVWRRYIHARLTKKAEKIICESSFVKNDIIKFFNVPSRKIEVIPAPPISMEKEMSLDNSPCKNVKVKYSLPEQYLFYPAQFWAHKNHDRLIKAFASLCEDFPSMHLVFTGKERDRYIEVFDHVNRLGLQKRILHIGYIDQNDLSAIYQLCTALVMPSLFESVSLPIYEAFQVGVPVCASNVVALPEQIGDAGILFDPLSVQSISDALRALLGDPKLRSELKIKGKNRMLTMTHVQYGLRLNKILN